MQTRPVNIDDLRRIEYLIDALESGCLDPRGSGGAAAVLEDLHANNGARMTEVGDRLLARELWHAGIVLTALRRGEPIPIRDGPPVLRACSVPGCGQLVTLWFCPPHEMAAL